MDPQLIADIINTTFQHHVHQSLEHEYVALQLVQINQRYSEQLHNHRYGLRSQTYFTLIFRQDPQITDAIDPTLILEQLRTIVFASWIHVTADELQKRQQRNVHTTPIQPSSKDRMALPKPSPSPWTPFLDFYLPACNAPHDDAYAIVTGLPITVDYFNNRRFLLHINDRFHDMLTPYLPAVMTDPITYPNLIGLRTGKFTSSSPTPQSTMVAYIAASHIDCFENLYQAQNRLFLTTKTQYFDFYGIKLRITPLPNSSLTGLELRNRLHEAYDLLYATFHEYTKVLIPIDYFTMPVTDEIINTILRAKYVKACIPFFQDETNSDPDHYVLFLVNCVHTTFADPNTLYEVITDFPPGLVQPPSAPVTAHPTQSQARNTTKHTSTFQDAVADDIAFLQLLTNTTKPDIPSPNNQIPSLITTSPPKRPHHPSGATIQPIPRRPKPATCPTPQDNMDVDVQPPDDHTTTTTDTDGGSIPSSQFHIFRNATPVESYRLHPENIPDNQYLFDPTHSQQTRLEVLDALGVAKTVLYQNYENTITYATNHKHIDIDQLKAIATQQPPTPPRAHNDSQAPPHDNHE
jgi:hypothetical protein